MGFFNFGRKKSSLTMGEAQPMPSQYTNVELGPVTLNLDNNRLVYDNGQWHSDFMEGSLNPAAPEGSLEKEVIELRKEKRKLRRDLERYTSQIQEMKDLKEKWNLLDFKYQLLVDMWSMRMLDNERGGMTDKDGGLSPARSSKKNGLSCMGNY